jgi:hypothetical protein
MSLRAVFGSGDRCQLSPPKGPKWKAAELKALSHFINCHGAPSDPQYYGQSGNSFPSAHSAAWVNGKLSTGTVTAAECCYGAEMYDPADAGGQMGICNTYLASGAYGFLGSSTIAYGPAEGNGAADLLCQYFLREVLMGASLGRAALTARQEFARQGPVLDPIDQKTLAQFSLLGDPSIHPVMPLTPDVAMAHGAVAKRLPSLDLDLVAGRGDRRRSLEVWGEAIRLTVSVAVRTPKPALAPPIGKALRALAKQTNVSPSEIISFGVRAPKGPMAAKALGPSRAVGFHMMFSPTRKAARGPEQGRVVVAKEEGGKIVSYRVLHRR